MADEITVIGIGVDTTQVVKAATDLDKLAAAGSRAEKSAETLSASAGKIGKNLSGTAGAIERTGSAAQALSGSLGSAGANLGRTASGLAGVGTAAGAATTGLRGVSGGASAAIAGISGIAGASRQASPAAQALAGDLNSLEGASRKAGDATASLGRSFGGVAGIFGGIALGAVAQQAVQLADSVSNLDARLKLATRSAQEFAIAREAIFGISQETGTGFEQSARLFGDINRAVETLDVSQQRVLGVTKSINQALAVSGTAAASSAAALVQLGQGFASGVLRGEELNSVLEQAPRLARAIADGLGVSVGSLRKLGEEGKLTGEQVFQALEKSAAKIDSEFSRLPLTVSRATTQAANSVLVLVGALDSASGASGGLAGVISDAAGAIAELAKEVTKVSQGADSVSVLANAFVTLSEVVRVLGANVAFVFGAVGREAGAIFAQIELIAGVLRAPPDQLLETARTNWRKFNAISEAVKEDGARARAELDRLEARILSRTPTPDLGQTDRRELARRGRVADPFGRAAAPTGSAGTEKISQAQRYIESLRQQLQKTEELTAVETLLADIQAGRLGKILPAQVAIAKGLAAQIDASKALVTQEKAAAQIAKERAQARAEESASIEKYFADQAAAASANLVSLKEREQGLRDEEAASLLSAAANISLAEAIEQVALARKREELSRLNDGDSDNYRALVREIEARERILELVRSSATRAASTNAAKDAAAEWKRSADQIEQSLTDALLRGFESGKDFARSFKDSIANLFKTLVLRPIIQGIVQPVAGGITNLLGQGQGGAAGALQQAQSLYGQLSSLYGTVTDYGSRALSFFGAGGASAANVGGAYATAGSAFEVANGVAAGSSAASSATAASSASYASIYAAIIVAASNAAARDFKNGFNQNSARNIDGALGPLAGTTSQIGDVLRKIGISNEAASILSGETLISKLFGRSSRVNVEGRNIVGNIDSSGFDGTFDVRTRQKGGVFSSDLVATTREALGGDIDRAIDETTAQLRAQAKKYGAALGLPVEAIDSVVRAFNVDVTFADQEETIKRIQAELSKYGDTLLETFAPALDGVKKLGETTTQTIERVAGSLLSVNEVLKSIGVTSLNTSVAGGTAALALQDLFGGLQGLQTASAAYFNEFFTAEQKQDQLRAQLTKSFADINQALPTTREGFKKLVESQDLTTESGRQAFTTLLAVSGAFAELVPVLESAAKSAKEIRAEAIQKQLADIAAAVGDFGVLDTSKNLSQQLTEGRTALEALETGLASAMGSLSKTILEQLNDLIASQKALQSFRSGLGDTISSARLAGLDGPSRVAALKARESALFGELGTSSDPVEVAGRLQQTILDRIAEETTLRQQAADAVETQLRKSRDAQIDGLKTQISAYSRLSDIAKNVLAFTSDLRSSDISPLSFEQRLAESKKQFDASFEKAATGDVNAASALTGNAKTYLDQARAYFGSSAAYADIFAQVTGSLDALAGTAPTDPQIAGLQAQADALADLNATQAKQVEANVGLVAALEALDSSLALRESDKQKEIDARAKEVADQIAAQKEANLLLQAQIEQAREGYGRLQEELMTLNGHVARLVGNANLAVAEPS